MRYILFARDTRLVASHSLNLSTHRDPVSRGMQSSRKTTFHCRIFKSRRASSPFSTTLTRNPLFSMTRASAIPSTFESSAIRHTSPWDFSGETRGRVVSLSATSIFFDSACISSSCLDFSITSGHFESSCSVLRLTGLEKKESMPTFSPRSLSELVACAEIPVMYWRNQDRFTISQARNCCTQSRPSMMGIRKSQRVMSKIVSFMASSPSRPLQAKVTSKPILERARPRDLRIVSESSMMTAFRTRFSSTAGCPSLDGFIPFGGGTAFSQGGGRCSCCGALLLLVPCCDRTQ
mmetsp:Transcript_32597/g.64614  ORF Transcript_32597/g.64614 Transcript_32597/m.64614 type:complete len:292 (+) Transcript_32597:409-1284(+)